MPQILGYVTPTERDRFHAYARELGLDITALANLLIAREIRTQRLAKLLLRASTDRPSRMRAKIVAHVPTAAIKLAFDARAMAVEVKPARAATILFRAELEERWLERSLLIDTFDSI